MVHPLQQLRVGKLHLLLWKRNHPQPKHKLDISWMEGMPSLALRATANTSTSSKNKITPKSELLIYSILNKIFRILLHWKSKTREKVARFQKNLNLYPPKDSNLHRPRQFSTGQSRKLLRKQDLSQINTTTPKQKRHFSRNSDHLSLKKFHQEIRYPSQYRIPPKTTLHITLRSTLLVTLRMGKGI